MPLADYFRDEKTAPWAWLITAGAGFFLWKKYQDKEAPALGNPDYGGCGCGCKGAPGGCGSKKSSAPPHPHHHHTARWP